jgi:acetolactate synthase-1/2/3 large subunit
VNGAEAVVRTLIRAGVDTCFTNPGTSEMHFVAALDTAPEMRGVLALFEGVATGAADGYGRMTDRPAATLLHLGPGLANGIANLHNARRARTPVVNIVGDHATHHARYDAPLQSDIESLARPVSCWVRRSLDVATVAADAAEAVAASHGPPGGVATLILPADIAWLEGASAAAPVDRDRPRPVDDETIAAVARALASGAPTALLLGGRALRTPALRAASRIANATGARLLCETFPARLQRGAGIPPVERLSYLAEFATAQLDGLCHLVLVDARSPVSFFAYPGKPSSLVPESCTVHTLVDATDDVSDALDRLVDAVAPRAEPTSTPAARPPVPGGALTGETLAGAVGALLPEGAIVVDEANTAGLWLAGATAGAPPHDWLTLTGGAIGQGLPVATGAAIACPDRRVLCLEADGSAMYTIQALWTQAREGLDVTTVVLDNRAYAVLELELSRVGSSRPPGPAARRLLELTPPDLDFAALARGLGLEAWRATTAEEFAELLGRSLATPGPSLIHAVVPRSW